MPTVFPEYVAMDRLFELAGKIVFIASLGAFGGIVHAVATLIEGDQTGKETIATRIAGLGVSVWTYFLWQALIGTGGAFAAVFGILTIGNAARGTGSSDLAITIYLAALCVVGGFVGFRLLTALGVGLERRFSDLDKKVSAKTEHAEKKAELADKKAETAIIELSDVRKETRERASQDDRKILRLGEARRIVDILEKDRMAPLDSGLRAEALDAWEKLEVFRRRSPMERVLTIVSANLSFELGLRGGDLASHLDTAEGLLVDFLTERRRDAVPESEDDEAAWFNLACYRAAFSVQNSDRRAELEQTCLDALSQSLRIARARDARSLNEASSKVDDDPDLGPLIGSPQFQDLLQSFGLVSPPQPG